MTTGPSVCPSRSSIPLSDMIAARWLVGANEAISEVMLGMEKAAAIPKMREGTRSSQR